MDNNLFCLLLLKKSDGIYIRTFSLNTWARTYVFASPTNLLYKIKDTVRSRSWCRKCLRNDRPLRDRRKKPTFSSIADCCVFIFFIFHLGTNRKVFTIMRQGICFDFPKVLTFLRVIWRSKVLLIEEWKQHRMISLSFLFVPVLFSSFLKKNYLFVQNLLLYLFLFWGDWYGSINLLFGM